MPNRRGLKSSRRLDDYSLAHTEERIGDYHDVAGITALLPAELGSRWPRRKLDRGAEGDVFG